MPDEAAQYPTLEEFLGRRGGVSDAGNALARAYQAIAGPVTNALGDYVFTPLTSNPFESPEASQGRGRAIAKLLPQTPTELAIALGTAGAGGLAAKAGLKGTAAIGTRILGGTAGGTLGAGVSGEDPALGAVQGAVGATTGEMIGTGLNLIRGIGSSRVAQKVQRLDAANMGTALGEIEPLFQGRMTPESLYQLLVRDPASPTAKPLGIRLLQDAQEKANAIIDAKVAGKVFANPQDPSTFVPYREARQSLSELYDKAFGGVKGQPLEPTIKGVDSKKLYTTGVDEMRRSLSVYDPTGSAAQLFDASREQYRVGRGLLRLLEQGFRTFGADKVGFNSDLLMGWLSKPKNNAKIGAALGPENLSRIEGALFRGQGPGHQDVFAPDTVVGRLMESLSLPGNAYLRTRLSVPQLVGNPLQLSSPARIGLDIGSEAALARTSEVLGSPLRIPPLPGLLSNPTPQP